MEKCASISATSCIEHDSMTMKVIYEQFQAVRFQFEMNLKLLHKDSIALDSLHM